MLCICYIPNILHDLILSLHAPFHHSLITTICTENFRKGFLPGPYLGVGGVGGGGGEAWTSQLYDIVQEQLNRMAGTVTHVEYIVGLVKVATRKMAYKYLEVC